MQTKERAAMNKHRTLKQYRNIDLSLFALMLAVAEYLIVRAANHWFPAQPYTVSVAAALVSLVYMRWGWWGAVHAVLAGLVFCYFSSASQAQYLVYCGGNLLSLLAVVLLLRIGKERVRTGALSLLFPLLVLLLMQLGRALMALVLGAAPTGLTEFFTTDSLSYLFTFVIIWIARRLDGIYEDQKHYLLRLHAKQELEKGGL